MPPLRCCRCTAACDFATVGDGPFFGGFGAAFGADDADVAEALLLLLLLLLLPPRLVVVSSRRDELRRRRRRDNLIWS